MLLVMNDFHLNSCEMDERVTLHSCNSFSKLSDLIYGEEKEFSDAFHKRFIIQVNRLLTVDLAYRAHKYVLVQCVSWVIKRILSLDKSFKALYFELYFRVFSFPQSCPFCWIYFVPLFYYRCICVCTKRE